MRLAAVKQPALMQFAIGVAGEHEDQAVELHVTGQGWELRCGDAELRWEPIPEGWCGACDGTGEVADHPCAPCGGTGRAP